MDDADRADVTTPDGEEILVEVRRSGVVRWQYDSLGLPEGLLVLPALLLWNAIGRVAFRGGWTTWVTTEDGDTLVKRRHRRRAAAVADRVAVTAQLQHHGRAALSAQAPE